MKYFIAGVFGIAVDSVMVVIYLVRRVGGGHHDDDVTFRRRAEGVVRKYTRIYWT